MDSAEKNIIILVIGIIASLSFYSLFTFIQSTFFSLSQALVKKHEEEGDKRAELILKMMANKPRILINCLVGKVFTSTLYTVFVYILLDNTISQVIIDFFGNKNIAVLICVLFISFILLLFFGELIPNMFTIQENYERIRKVIRPFYLISWIMYPFSFFAIKFISRFSSEDEDWNNQLGPAGFEDERDRYVNLGKEAGIIEEEEKEMISSVFEFGDTIAREVMVPRPDIVAMPINTSYDNLIEIIAEDGHSRFPVYDGSIDKIVGILYVKDILVKLKQIEKDYDLVKLLRKPFFVPETKNLNDLLREFQKKNQHLAIVVDEYGGVSGLVSIEDLLEEIVGEIVDEYDHEEQESITQIDERTYNVDARQSMPDLEGKLDCKFEYEDAETVGGFVMEKLGRIPVQGEVFEIPQGTFKITETKGNRILKVQIILNK